MRGRLADYLAHWLRRKQKGCRSAHLGLSQRATNRADGDLSKIYPQGGSVNDGISWQLCSLSYLAMDDMAKVALQLGRGAKLAKLDTVKAYHVVPICPDDRCLLGMK